MESDSAFIQDCLSDSGNRFEFWMNFINRIEVRNLVEIGVYRGEFSEKILRSCDGIKKYYLLDPWRNLANWDKPANVDDSTFKGYFDEAMRATEFAIEKRVVLRGKTTEIIDKIPDNSLDFSYIDGDHTLRGITIDLIKVFPKVRNGGYIGGDDFSRTIWQHSPNFEPTLIFPYALYFAEAMSVRIYSLPYDQFLISKSENGAFEFVDLAGNYSDPSLKNQFLQMIQYVVSQIKQGKSG